MAAGTVSNSFTLMGFDRANLEPDHAYSILDFKQEGQQRYNLFVCIMLGIPYLVIIMHIELNLKLNCKQNIVVIVSSETRMMHTLRQL